MPPSFWGRPGTPPPSNKTRPEKTNPARGKADRVRAAPVDRAARDGQGSAAASASAAGRADPAAGAVN